MPTHTHHIIFSFPLNHLRPVESLLYTHPLLHQERSTCTCLAQEFRGRQWTKRDTSFPLLYDTLLKITDTVARIVSIVSNAMEAHYASNSILFLSLHHFTLRLCYME